MNFISLILTDLNGIWSEHIIGLSLWMLVITAFIFILWTLNVPDAKHSLSLILTYSFSITTFGFILLFIPGLFLPAETPDPQTYRMVFLGLVFGSLVKIFISKGPQPTLSKAEVKNGKKK